MVAQVTVAIYDAATVRHLLIPLGSRLIGTHDGMIAFEQKRALVVWRRIVMPDGSSVVIENLPATNTTGCADLDFHSWRLINENVLSRLLGVGTELTFGEEESDLVRALRESTQNVSTKSDRLGMVYVVMILRQ